MTTSRTLTAAVVAAALFLTGCASDSDTASDDAAVTEDAVAAAPECPTPSPPPPTGEVAVAQPDDQGQALFDAICAATKTIDIVIYQIGSPQLQQALVAAMQRGVKVRVVVDGYRASQVEGGEGFASAIRLEAEDAGVPADALSINWSSDNFNITHQKSVIVDAVDDSGAALSPDALPPSARLLVSTGNFQEYQPEVKDPSSPTPLESPGKFFSARDFYVTTGDKTLIAEAARVFVSDFSCAGPTVTNDLRDSTDLVWSNGTTGLYADEVGQYPPVEQGYFGPDKVQQPPPVDQGNSFLYQLDLIENAQAGDLVRIYNEEFASTPFVRAVTEAAQRGVDVQFVMTYEPPSAKFGPSQSMVNLSKVAAAVPADSTLPGVTVTLFGPQAVFPDVLYIHAKAILVKGADGSFKGGFVGSENLSSGSMGYNRELGLPLTSADTQVVNLIQETFDADFASQANTTQWNKSNPSAVPDEWNSKPEAPASDRASADGSPGALEARDTKPVRCGPVVTG